MLLRAEHEQWVAGMHDITPVDRDGVHPFPAEPDGLPPGWEIRWYLPYRGVHFFLVERTHGGWCTVIHSTTKETTPAGPVAETLWGLYEQALEMSDPDSELADLTGHVYRLHHPIEAVVRDYALSFFDETNPIEAAEADRVRPGERLTLLPQGLPHR